MRGCIYDYDAIEPVTLDDALLSLAADPERTRPLAGGTDVMVALEAGVLPRGRYVSLARVPELQGIQVTRAGVTIGASTTFADIATHPAIRRDFPSLAAAAALIGGVAIQQRATIGGNIVNASPAADSPPVLLAYDAEVDVVSAAGTRRVPYALFHTGYRAVALGPGELVRSIFVPRRAHGHFFRKVGARRAQAIAKVVVAASRVREADGAERVLMAMGAVGPTVVRCAHVEALVAEAAGRSVSFEAMRAAVQADTAPIDDLRSSQAYRVHAATMVALEAVQGLARRP